MKKHVTYLPLFLIKAFHALSYNRKVLSLWKKHKPLSPKLYNVETCLRLRFLYTRSSLNTFQPAILRMTWRHTIALIYLLNAVHHLLWLSSSNTISTRAFYNHRPATLDALILFLKLRSPFSQHIFLGVSFLVTF